MRGGWCLVLSLSSMNSSAEDHLVIKIIAKSQNSRMSPTTSHLIFKAKCILWFFGPLKSDPKLNIMLKETFWGSQKGSGRAGILGVHGCCSLQGMPSPRDPCGHTPFMSPPFAAGVHSEILRLGHSGRNNRFRPRRESPLASRVLQG